MGQDSLGRAAWLKVSPLTKTVLDHDLDFRLLSDSNYNVRWVQPDDSDGTHLKRLRLDYKHEGKAMEQMRGALCGTVGGLVIPSVNWELTALRVLASECFGFQGFRRRWDGREACSMKSVGVVTQRYVHINVGTHIYIYIHMYVYVHKHTYICTYICLRSHCCFSLYIYIYIYIYTHIHAHVHIHTRIHPHVYRHMCICIYIYICIHTYTIIYVCIYRYT